MLRCSKKSKTKTTLNRGIGIRSDNTSELLGLGAGLHLWEYLCVLELVWNDKGSRDYPYISKDWPRIEMEAKRKMNDKKIKKKTLSLLSHDWHHVPWRGSLHIHRTLIPKLFQSFT